MLENFRANVLKYNFIFPHYYTTHITILKLHTTYILAVLVAYNFIPYFNCLLYRKQTNRRNTEINIYHLLGFTLLFTSLLATQKLVKNLLTFKID